MVREAGAEYVIIGHSERRRLFGETDELVNRKLVAALGAKLTPIVCIGETLEEREGNQTLAVLDRQIKVGLDGMTGEQIGSLVIAYEPVWAIGTGRNATPAAGRRGARAHPQRLRQWFGGDAADHCHVIYGGSVKPDNIHELIALPDVDGALVGGRQPGCRGRSADIVSQEPPAARYNRTLCSTTCSPSLYVLSCLLLLLVVLLQQGKGGDMASAFGGGGSQTAFGARAGATVLTQGDHGARRAVHDRRDRARHHRQARRGSVMGGVGAPAPATGAAPATAPAAAGTGTGRDSSGNAEHAAAGAGAGRDAGEGSRRRRIEVARPQVGHALLAKVAELADAPA